MIGYLAGQVVSSHDKTIVLDVNGVGYRVGVNSTISLKTAREVRLKLFVHTHQTNDTTSLFGFKTEEELKFFELLISVNGVGPRTALEILETPASKIKQAIITGDTKALGKAKGLGPKTAARIVLELKNKLVGGAIEVPNLESQTSTEVITALENLGYKKSQIEKVLEKLSPGVTKTEEIVTWFLKAI